MTASELRANEESLIKRLHRFLPEMNRVCRMYELWPVVVDGQMVLVHIPHDDEKPDKHRFRAVPTTFDEEFTGHNEDALKDSVVCKHFYAKGDGGPL